MIDKLIHGGHVPRFLMLAHSLNFTFAEALLPILHQFLYDTQLDIVYRGDI